MGFFRLNFTDSRSFDYSDVLSCSAVSFDSNCFHIQVENVMLTYFSTKHSSQPVKQINPNFLASKPTRTIIKTLTQLVNRALREKARKIRSPRYFSFRLSSLTYHTQIFPSFQCHRADAMPKAPREKQKVPQKVFVLRKKICFKD